MRYTQKLIGERRLPDVMKFADGTPVNEYNWENRRREILDMLCREEYGYAPPAPAYVNVEKDGEEKRSFAGKALIQKLNFTVPTDKEEFTFPVVQLIPTKRNWEKLPVFVLVSFTANIPDRSLPVELIMDAGCAVLRIYYNDIAFDGEDHFEGGIASRFDRSKYTWGKISMWAWAASRVRDYLDTLDWVDRSRVAVVGQSRLGKTALWCAACDDRFSLACVNESGCSGDAITRDKQGERVANITGNFPYWFCESYKKYVDNEHAMPFDQHFLLAAVCPRKLALGAAMEDQWSDPDSQYLSACAASPVWEVNGGRGFIHPERLPVPGDFFNRGEVTFHLRDGAHGFSTEDWGKYLTIIMKP